ncbi:hypothetical protein FXN63_10560 [Pigmentiphaga aceris]|uniref:Uncharacterized protein n=1 Tax=Pigmentiphaga aceris TaxID=1940612 RepID=A0A5C0B065_9BURK|nr:hypothetical protein [Pigmentiphaga aceris]QEI06231.1 hypothetical protein FXN63_10560 [Pigmentiphaga aceris]
MGTFFEAVFLVLLLGFLGLAFLAMVALCGLAYYYLFKKIATFARQALIRATEARVTGFEISIPDLTQSDASDARPMIHLHLEDSIRQSQFSLGPVPCRDVFIALGEPENLAACWMTDDDWRQLLQNRQISVIRDARSKGAVLATDMRQQKQMLISFLIALAILAAMAVAQT